ncbi:hypothetical protein PITC_012470 [Penicillium italicum]|uniref:Uncharacterized protein n=1 Tax=Penicillium italicum TaxID=40296 RepID=A0A0A2KI27_PENIT|nr:hypothetical protein PITC_012470 [Penicillium italicum]
MYVLYHLVWRLYVETVLVVYNVALVVAKKY